MKIAHLRRRCVTLLELLIVIAIVALVGGIATIGTRKALGNQQFRAEVSRVVDLLRLAQDLMLIFGTDARVKFSSKGTEKEGIAYRLELETTLSPHIEREVLRNRGLLKTIKTVIFGDAKGEIEIKFQSRGAVMSRGVMQLTTTDENPPPASALQAYICLAGYPRPIVSTDDAEKAFSECDRAAELNADIELTQDTFSKLPESLQAS